MYYHPEFLRAVGYYISQQTPCKGLKTPKYRRDIDIYITEGIFNEIKAALRRTGFTSYDPHTQVWVWTGKKINAPEDFSSEDLLAVSADIETRHKAATHPQRDYRRKYLARHSTDAQKKERAERLIAQIESRITTLRAFGYQVTFDCFNLAD